MFIQSNESEQTALLRIMWEYFFSTEAIDADDIDLMFREFTNLNILDWDNL
jgi:hypothetical protein